MEILFLSHFILLWHFQTKNDVDSSDKNILEPIECH